MNKIALVNISDTFKSPFSEEGRLGEAIGNIVSAAMIIGGILILFLLIFAGLSIIGGAGSDNPEGVEKGKKAATAAVIGFAIIFASYWIIRIIELITGNNLNNFITQPGI